MWKCVQVLVDNTEASRAAWKEYYTVNMGENEMVWFDILEIQ